MLTYLLTLTCGRKTQFNSVNELGYTIYTEYCQIKRKFKIETIHASKCAVIYCAST